MTTPRWKCWQDDESEESDSLFVDGDETDYPECAAAIACERWDERGGFAEGVPDQVDVLVRDMTTGTLYKVDVYPEYDVRFESGGAAVVKETGP